MVELEGFPLALANGSAKTDGRRVEIVGHSPGLARGIFKTVIE